jgi:hypothetical protein
MNVSCGHLNMLCLLYKQHRPITLLYITTPVRYSPDANDMHPTLVSLNLENGEVSLPVLCVLCASERSSYYKELADREGLADEESVDYYPCSPIVEMIGVLDAS